MKNIILITILTFLAVSFLASGAGATILKYNTTDQITDASIIYISWSGGYGTYNYGNSATFAGDTLSGIMRCVDCSGAGNNISTAGLINATNFLADVHETDIINSVNLTIYQFAGCSADDMNVTVRNILTPWNEGDKNGGVGAASWYSPKPGISWASGIAFSALDYGKIYAEKTLSCSTPGFYTFELNTALIISDLASRAIPFEGFAIVVENESTNNAGLPFYMSEYATGEYVPTITIDYIANYTPPIPPIPPPNSATTYCESSEILLIRDYGYADNGSAVLSDRYEKCSYGCLNSTITGLGAAGCAESPLQNALLFMVALVGVIAVLAWLDKR